MEAEAEADIVPSASSNRGWNGDRTGDQAEAGVGGVAERR